MRKIIEDLLERPLTTEDGYSLEEIVRKERELQVAIPEALSTFFRVAGRCTTITQAFERFIPLENLEVKEDMIIFLEENQHICYWGVSLKDDKVYQSDAEDHEKILEDIKLENFIKSIIYHNYVQAVAPYSSYGSIELEEIVEDYKEVVNYNNFKVYLNKNNAIWTINSKEYYLSFSDEEEFNKLTSKYSLTNLN